LSEEVILHDAERKRWLHFRDPCEVISTNRVEAVVSQFERVNALIRDRGLYGVGFLSYEAAPAFDSALATHAPTSFPLLWFGLYREPEVIHFPPLSASASPAFGRWRASVTPEEYESAIARIKKYIALGETYQVNYSFRLQADFSGDPQALFWQLARSQEADYAAYLDIGKYAICSASPELFFQLAGEQLRSRPMKGTAARGLTLAADEAQEQWLQASEKNRAENVMIADMIRNDMGRIARLQSVRVPSLFEVERYPTVWQMTSTVESCTRASLSEIMAALFPCASIVGAPKPRTMQIVRDLETTPRRLYTGCIGFISRDRQAQFNVAIRTVLIDKEKGEAEYGVGGGVVWDSECDDEYEECLLKAQVLTANRPPFSLLETMLWQPGEGFFLLAYHLRRLGDSARYFGFQVDLAAIEETLQRLAKSLPSTPQRVRLLVGREGKIDCQVAPLPVVKSQPVRLRLASTPIDSTDPFLYHKTTHRQVYDEFRAACPEVDDVLLWNDRGEITETCIANVVVQRRGELLTPPIECGLLAGTFRNSLRDRGLIREAVIRVEDLPQCDRIFVINSVRKWRDAAMLSY